MGGAYTAKAETESEADVPTGWDKDWAYPGPDPPGYDPDEEDYFLELEVASPGYITVDDPAITVTASLYEDNGEYDSVNIDTARSYITWFATINGVTIGFSPATSTMSALFGHGNAFGANPDMIFSITEADEDEDIVVDAIATVYRDAAATDADYVEIPADATVSIHVRGEEDPIVSFTATLTINSATQTGYFAGIGWPTDIKMMARKGSSSLRRSWGAIDFDPQEDYDPEISTTEQWDDGEGAGVTISVSESGIVCTCDSPDDSYSYWVHYYIGKIYEIIDFTFNITLSWEVTYESGASDSGSYTNIYSSGVNIEFAYCDIDTGLAGDTFQGAYNGN